MRRKRLFEVLMASTPELHGVFDAEHRLSDANASFLRLWGRSLEEAHGMSLLELGFASWHAEMHCCEIDQVVRSKEPVRGEVAFSGTAGTHHRVYGYDMVPVLSAEGEVEAVCLRMRDVTERKLANEREALIANLTQQLIQLRSEEEIMRHVVKTVGGILGAHRCYFVESLDGGARIAVSENWVRDKAPSLAGSLSLFEAGGGDRCGWYFAGKAACDDVRRHPVAAHRASHFEDSFRGSDSSIGLWLSGDPDAHVESTYATALDASGNAGTYLVFYGLTATDLQIARTLGSGEIGFTGIQVVEAIPEPSSALAGLAIGLLVLRRQRRA